MATFRGTVQGERGEASRLGHKHLDARLAGWQGAVEVSLWKDAEDRDCASVTLRPGNGYGSEGPSVTLYDGPIDNSGREIASGHVPNPPKEA